VVPDSKEDRLRPAFTPIVIVAYVGVVIAAFFAGDWAQLVVVSLGLVTGALIARWWSVALSLTLPVVDIFVGADAGDAGPSWLVTLAFITPLVAVATALGVLAGRWVRRRREMGRTAH
jgi:hypothetical protein